MYLVGDAKLWWRTRAQEVSSGGKPDIEEWVVLKKELRAQFLPCNAAWLAKGSFEEFERLMNYRAAVTSSGKKEQGGKKHLYTKTVDKGKKAKVVQDGAKSGESKDKKTFSSCFLCQMPHRVKDSPRKQNLNAIVAKGNGVISPEDHLGEDAIVQPVLEVIEVFVDRPLKTWFRIGIWIVDWRDAACSVGTLSRYLEDLSAGVLHKFEFELVYMTTRHRDFVEQLDELMTDGAQSDSSISDPLESESEEELWESSAVDSILRNAMFENRMENSEAKEEPIEERELWVESMTGIIVISSDDEDEPVEEFKVEVILVESSDDESMGESNAEVVQASLSHVQRNEDRQGVELTRASGSCGRGWFIRPLQVGLGHGMVLMFCTMPRQAKGAWEVHS
ncbi:hypothetical protein GBA52_009377 [Prunus armeniaca]|nr:hypothetical protein GBA52_009377 [Prunus armeniaca]